MDYIYLRTYNNWRTLMESSISLSSVSLFDERDKQTLLSLLLRLLAVLFNSVLNR